MTALPTGFVSIPLAHRALHDVTLGRPENSRAAVRAAVAHGYGVEIDLQLSADGQAMVFHDYALDRLTGQTGPLHMRSAADLANIALSGGDGEGIPTLDEVLRIVDAAVPVLIEIKDQDGAMGPAVGPLERATARAVAGYRGDVAVMSFNPHSVAAFAQMAPDVPRGLATSAFDASEWHLPVSTCDRLREIPDADTLGAQFISHEACDLHRPRVAVLKNRGLPILCWTIRSQDAEQAARAIADNITFEGYMAKHPA